MCYAQDRTVRLWNPHKGLLVKTYIGHGYDVRDAVVAADNRTFASVGGDRMGPFLWDVASGNVVRKFKGHDATINAVRDGEWSGDRGARGGGRGEGVFKGARTGLGGWLF